MKKNKHKIHLILLFIVYIAVLAYVLFFADMFGRTDVSEEYRYNFVPFKEILIFWNGRKILPFYVVFLNLAGNVLAFMPFGFFLPMLVSDKRKNFPFIFMCGLLTTCSIEFVQLISRVGCCDVDDLILNSSGVILGYIIYAAGKAIARTCHRRKK